MELATWCLAWNTTILNPLIMDQTLLNYLFRNDWERDIIDKIYGILTFLHKQQKFCNCDSNLSLAFLIK